MEVLRHTCILGGPQQRGTKIRIGCFSHASSRAQKWAEVLRHHCILGGLQQRGTHSELAASVMPPRGPKSGRKCYFTPAFSGVPNKGKQNQNWLPQPCLLGGRQVGGSAASSLNSQGCPTKENIFELAASTTPSRGPKRGRKCYVTAAFWGFPNKGEHIQNWLPQPCLLRGPKVGGSAMSPLHSRRSPTKGNIFRIGCLSHASSGAQKWAEVLRHPCILGGTHQRGTKSELAASPLHSRGPKLRERKSELAASTMPSRGPKSGRKCYVTPAFSGVRNKGEQNQNWLPQPCLLGGRKVGGSAAVPHAFSGVPNKGKFF